MTRVGTVWHISVRSVALLLVLWPACSVAPTNDSPAKTDSDAAAVNSDHLVDVIGETDAVGDDASPDCDLSGFDCDGPCGLGFQSGYCENGHPTCPPDSYDPLFMPCSCLPDAWTNFVSLPQGCADVGDCEVVGGVGSCACEVALGNGSGDALSKQNALMAQKYLTRFAQCKVAPPATWKLSCAAAPAQNLRCEKYLCLADSASCTAELDGSLDATPD